ncbi:HAMP domain-containing histidine kinase [Roseibium denhamense]|uniref:histidine kinase n=1 Tax=Roseibium denhamense TaxID=76305 RepID=A0ABY1P0N9_9HYPH|nr:HAMP domain-containing sensor histidine kinase [Roseibium denhamense]MTI04945.1 HAMP domain-containing histidine kinase [Roseibium denhamense]SMP23539.1 signal transduction histidine kinase /histidine kinase [Roseibium denhamense]
MKHQASPDNPVPASGVDREGAPDLEMASRFGRHRFGGLSGKLLLLTILFVMIAEVFIYVPSIANFRNTWLKDRLATAGVAASVLAETNTIAPRLQEELLRATGAVTISLDQGSRRSLIAMSGVPSTVDFSIDLAKDNPWRAVTNSFALLAYRGDGYMRVVGAGQMAHTERVDVVFPVRLLQQEMRAFSYRILALSLVISVFTAGLVYITLRAVFIRPLRRLTRSMEQFAENPEDASGIIEVSARQDELGDAEIRLAKMEEALSRALHQKQRLADLGLAVSKINHDLRNLLASAQLFLERLEHVPDPTVSRLAPKILATLDRAVGYTQAVMAYGKAQERAPQRRLLNLHRVGEDVADVLGILDRPGITFENKVSADLEVDADPEQLFRVLLNLARNAVQALEAEKDETLVRRITLEATRAGKCVHIIVSDTGPGIPANLRPALFKAFHSGSKTGGIGLGLAIVAELLKAHGGKIVLDEAEPCTCFRIELPDRSV